MTVNYDVGLSVQHPVESKQSSVYAAGLRYRRVEPGQLVSRKHWTLTSRSTSGVSFPARASSQAKLSLSAIAKNDN